MEYVRPQVRSRLLEYLARHQVNLCGMCSDGALIDPVRFPLAAVEANGAILFADLPGYSRWARDLTPAECAYRTSHFFAWFEGSAGRQYGGIVDKFIGDELMLVFLPDLCQLPAMEATLKTACRMLEQDMWGFEPRIGVAEGDLAICLVGTERFCQVTAVGHAVNLAARCVQTSEGAKSIRVATDDIVLVGRVFSGEQDWHVCPPRRIQPKNMDWVSVVDIRRLPMWIPNLDYVAHVREQVEVARGAGAIKRIGQATPSTNQGGIST